MFKIVGRVEYDVMEPVGGVTTMYETEDYDGDLFETLEEAKKRLYGPEPGVTPLDSRKG